MSAAPIIDKKTQAAIDRALEAVIARFEELFPTASCIVSVDRHGGFAVAKKTMWTVSHHEGGECEGAYHEATPEQALEVLMSRLRPTNERALALRKKAAALLARADQLSASAEAAAVAHSHPETSALPSAS